MPPKQKINNINVDNLNMELNTTEERIMHCANIIKTKKPDGRTNKKFYIGASYDPETRLKDHYNDPEKRGMIMFLLCKTISKEETDFIEDKLIEYFECKNLLNKEMGGGGLKKQINYIYVMV